MHEAIDSVFNSTHITHAHITWKCLLLKGVKASKHIVKSQPFEAIPVPATVFASLLHTLSLLHTKRLEVEETVSSLSLNSLSF